MLYYIFACFFFQFWTSATGIQCNYDYIVVGAGSSGATLAGRLSEDEDVSVLLIEAGGPPPPESEIPVFPLPLQNTSVDWGYLTEPQKYACWGYEGKRSYWPRGKVLGGSSILNYMVYNRGNKLDFDEWAANGCTGWSYNGVLPYFKKSEGNSNEDLANKAPHWHSKDGPLTVSSPELTFRTPLGDAFLEAGKELGYDIQDYNGVNQKGFSRVQATIRDGKRCSTEKAFLQPAYERKNFDVLTYARVIKIGFDKSKRAEKVIYIQDGKTAEVVANREIILSSGSIGSTHILLLSGIGPKKHLEKHEIPVVADLPVGQNLQDHMGPGGLYFILNTSVSLSAELLNEEAHELFKNGKGPLTLPGGMEGLGFVNTKYNTHRPEWPDIQLTLISNAFIPTGIEQNLLKELNTLKNKDVITILPFLMRPIGRGFIELRSNDPLDPPVIEPMYLANQDDVNLMVESMKIARRIAESRPFQKYNPKVFPEVLSGCEGHVPWSDAYLECVSRTLTFTIYHPIGTCKMGDPWDPTTVVDPELRVKGVKGLRVADASIMPIMISANTNAASIMIGEKAADLIKISRHDFP